MAYNLSLATASPAHKYQQNQLAERMIQELKLIPSRKEDLRKSYLNSEIETRHSVLDNLDLLFKKPTAKERNDIYKSEAPKLALSAAKKALTQWQESPDRITHVISVSCSGMMAPGIEYFLIKELSLRTDGSIRLTELPKFSSCEGPLFWAVPVCHAPMLRQDDRLQLHVEQPPEQ